MISKGFTTLVGQNCFLEQSAESLDDLLDSSSWDFSRFACSNAQEGHATVPLRKLKDSNVEMVKVPNSAPLLMEKSGPSHN